MFIPALDTSADLAIALLIHYSFDLSGYSASELVDLWQKQYPGNWLHLAVIEALYQGRYKAISVQQILICWQRRGQAIFHFNMEFERLICSKFPQSLTSLHEDTQMWGTGDSHVSEPRTLSAKGTPRERVSESSSRSEAPVREAYPTTDSASPSSAVPQAQDMVEIREGWLLRQDPKAPRSNNCRSVEGTGVRLPITDGEAETENMEIRQRKDAKTRGRENIFARPSVPPSFSSLTPPTSVPHQEENLPPVATNNPPIEQFTPQTSTCSESFTSKLKAMSNDKLLSHGQLPDERLAIHTQEEIKEESSLQ
nr:hypothetical protein [Mastigocladopsis repens]